jgi:hypothetical protein
MGRRALVLLLAASLGLAACRVDATVTVRVRPDGSGTVTVRVHLDRAAVQAATAGGGSLTDRVRLGDLRAAGWRIRWDVAKSQPPASATLTLSKRFARARDAAAVVREVSGTGGPLRDVRVTRDASTFRTQWSVRGTVELQTVHPGVAGDRELAGRLSAQRVDVASVDAALLAQLRDALHLSVVASLPHGDPTRWDARVGEVTVLRASTSHTDAARLLWLGAGIALALVAIVLVVVGERASRRRRRARPRV